MKLVNYLIENWETISLAVGGVVAFFTGRKTKKISNQSSELDNLKTVREIEKQLVEDMKVQIIDLLQVNNNLELIVKAYETKYGKLHTEVEEENGAEA